jgi:chromosome segregation ATPase
MATELAPPTTSAKEAKRIELAKVAANHDKANADLKAFVVKLRERQEAEERRRRGFEDESAKLRNEAAKLRSALKRAGAALDELRRDYVARELRMAVSESERAERAAVRSHELATQEVRSGRSHVQGLKERLAAGSGNANDVRTEIASAEAAMAATELAEVKAREALDAAKATADKARAAYNAAMAAALAL